MPLFVSELPEVRSWEQLRSMAAEIIDTQQANGATEKVSCQSGCTDCCYQMVPVGPTELARLRRAIRSLDSSSRDRVERRIASTATTLRSLGFTAEFSEPHPERRRQLRRRYFDQAIPCPLLEDGTCVVRDERPLVCRDYLVSSDPVHCSTMDPERVVRIRRNSNTAQRFAEAEARGGRTSHFVLALALAARVPELAPFESQSTIESMHELLADRPLSG